MPVPKKGEVRNPNGLNARVKLSRQFIADLQKDYEEHGAATLRTLRENEPYNYTKIIASLLPKDVNINVKEGSALDGLDAGQLEALREFIAGITAGNRPTTIENEGSGELVRVHASDSAGESTGITSPVHHTEA